MQATDPDPPAAATSETEPPPRPKLRPDHGIAAVALAVLVVEHVVHGVRRLPAAYGGDYATEYLEHLRRMEFYALLRDLPDAEASLQAWRALDRVEFPPLLVLFQYPLDLLLGPHPGVAVAANLGWLALAGVATWSLARSLGLERAAPWAGVILVLIPGMWGPARTYYYDVPMIALIAVGTAAAVAATRRPRVHLAFVVAAAWACAELVKWEAVLYLGAVLPALLVAALLQPTSWKQRAGSLAVLVAGCAGAAGGVAAYVSRHRGAWDARFGQAVSLNQGQDPEGGAPAVVGGLFQRLAGAGIDAWGFYPQWLTASSLGLIVVLLTVVAVARVHRIPRAAAAGAALAMLGTLAAVVGVSDIQEVRFVHPALPWLAVLIAGGLGALPGRWGRVAPAGAVVLATAQLLAADYVRESDDSPLRRGVVGVPHLLHPLVGSAVSPLPQSPGNQTGWRRPVDHRVNDALALRSAIAWMAEASGGRRATVALHPLNRNLGRAEYAWAYWSLHRGGLTFQPGRPLEDCGVDLAQVEARAPDFLVLDFDPALLGGTPEGWCRSLECSGDGTVTDLDPCGAVPRLLRFGVDRRSSPAIPYRPRSGGAPRHLWVLARGAM